ncbi:MAG: oligosaccharide flippase family protein [Bacteroidales bacterium]|nr:oligosaccharide flippase family protein [Bacteroidales bacterium]
MNIKKNIFKNTAKLIFVRYITIPLNIITGILLARVLGPQKLGIYAVMMWLPGILAGPMSLGIGNANLYFAAQGEKYLKPLVANSIWICIFLSVIMVLITYSVLTIFPNVLPQGLTNQYILIPLLQIPFRFFIMFNQNIFNALEEQSFYRKVELFQQISYFLLCISGYFLLKIELWGFVYARIFSLMIPCIYIIIILYRKKIMYFNLSWSLLQESIRYGMKIQCSSIARQFSQKIDELIVFKFAGAASLGYLSICRNNVNRLRILPYSLATVIAPRFVMGDKESAILAAKSIRILLCLMSIILPIMVSAVGFIIPFFYGNEYINAVFPMRLMLFVLIPLCFQRIITFYLMINNYTTFILKSSLAAAAILILCDLCFIPQFGLIGAIIAGILALAFESAILSIFFIKLSGINFFTLVIPAREDFQYLTNLLFNKDKTHR